MHDSVILQELKNLTMMYKLINTVTSPSRITNNTIPLIDIIITNKQNYEISATVLDLGYSDHQAQILHINVNEPKRGPVKVRKRQFIEESIEEFSIYYKKNHGKRSFQTLM
jgi:hypothetical protein